MPRRIEWRMFKAGKRLKKIGASPGTLVYIGKERVEKPRITVIDYEPEQVRERELETVEEALPFLDQKTLTWINVDGIHQVDLVEKLGQHCGLHALTLEDILHTNQRPKVEEFERYVFVVLRMLHVNETLDSEQVSLVLGPNLVLTFQERPGDVFDPVRQRIRTGGRGRIRKLGADYLFYALIDTLVDNYFVVLESLGDTIEKLGDDLVEQPRHEHMEKIQKLKAKMVLLRRSVYPLREVINRLERLESGLIQHGTRVFLRDVYDHTIQVIETVETFRDMTAGLVDLYLSSVSNKMNEIMKVLTIMASIFIPLTFIAGIYGMNFENMPELHTRWGYFVTLALMLVIATGMVVFFKRKEWM